MRLAKAARTVLLIGIAGICMANSECDSEYSCSGACNHLAQCEDEWLIEEGASPMSDSTYAEYVRRCSAHCSAEADYDEIECVEDESCDRLRDGKCSE